MTDRDFAETINTIADNTQAWLDQNEADGGVCDFCCHLIAPGDRIVDYVTDGEIVTLVSALDPVTLQTGTLELSYSPEWLACVKHGCADAVDRKDPDALAVHAFAARDVERVGPITVDQEAHDNLAEVYRLFYAKLATRTEGIA